jgi:PIN domain nuclease of toxin-antitoxin system
MKILLDSHTLIWLYTGNEKLSKDARKAIEDPQNEIFISLASIWEMSIKIRLGKMFIGDVPLNQFVADVVENGIQILDIGLLHILKIQEMEFHHRDPFDRILFSQAIVENMRLVSVDKIADLYFENEMVKRIW